MKRNTIRTGGLVVIMMTVLFTTGCARMSAKHIDKGIQYYKKNQVCYYKHIIIILLFYKLDEYL